MYTCVVQRRRESGFRNSQHRAIVSYSMSLYRLCVSFCSQSLCQEFGRNLTKYMYSVHPRSFAKDCETICSGGGVEWTHNSIITFTLFAWRLAANSKPGNNFIHDPTILIVFSSNTRLVIRMHTLGCIHLSTAVRYITILRKRL